MSKPIDPIEIQQAVKRGQLQAYVSRGLIYIRDTMTQETVAIGEVTNDGERTGYSSIRKNVGVDEGNL